MLSQSKPETSTTADDLVRRQVDALSGYRNERKEKADARRRILEERFADLVDRRISETHHDPNIKGRIKKFISLAINPGRDITNALACVYKQGVRREIKGSKRKTEALQRLNEESRMPVLAPILNKLAWFVGPTLEVPCMRNGRLCRDIITADRLDVLVDPDDPLGTPVAAAYRWQRNGEDVIVLLDEKQRRTYNIRGALMDTEDHGLVDATGKPMFPGTIWRFSTPIYLEDWWCSDANARLVDATIECAFIYSLMNWVRKSQNRNVLSYFGNLERIQRTNKIDPEQPFIAHVTDDDPIPQFDIKSLSVSPTEFIEHIMFVYRTMVESYGVPQSAVTFDFTSSGGSNSTSSTQPASGMALQHERLSQLRNELIPYAREAEISSQARALAVAHAGGHSLAAKLPSVKDVDEKLSIVFPEINRVDDPERMMRVLEAELKRGLTDDVHIMMMRRPDLNEEQAREAVENHLETQATLNEFKASRNMDPAEQMLDPNERNGMQGPAVRDGEVDDGRSDAGGFRRDEGERRRGKPGRAEPRER